MLAKKVRLSILSMFFQNENLVRTFLKRLGWANWICSCVISAIVGDIAGLRLEG